MRDPCCCLAVSMHDIRKQCSASLAMAEISWWTIVENQKRRIDSEWIVGRIQYVLGAIVREKRGEMPRD